ncbi:MAG: serine hydrolase, partial [Phaeodactylibacter sp.]|nr:serine hydrolase [Phaeodactylibacter sp.]
MKKWNSIVLAWACALSTIAQSPLGIHLTQLPERAAPQQSAYPHIQQSAHPLALRTFIPSELADTLQAVLKDQQEFLEILGVTAALRLPTGAVWSGGAGISEAGPDGAITAEHRSAIGSITKTIIAGVILDLYEEGLLDLDETMEDWGIQYLYVDPA